MRAAIYTLAVFSLYGSLLHQATSLDLTGYPAGYVFIDCGALEKPGVGANNFVTNTTTLPSKVVSYSVSQPWESGTVSTKANLSPEESTFRSFPSGKGCYTMQVPANTYSVRLGFAYYATDGMAGGAPNFTVSVQGVEVDQVALSDWEDEDKYDKVGTAPWGGAPGEAHYTEYVTRTEGEPLVICLQTVNERHPLVNTIELVPTTVPEMDEILPEMKWQLSLKKRFNMAGPTVGPAVEEDQLKRKWVEPSDSTQIYFLFSLLDMKRPEYSNISIASTGTSTDNSADVGNSTEALVGMKPGQPYFPSAIFETALEGGKLNESDPRHPQFLGIRFNYFPYSSYNQMFIRLLFAEIDGNVTKPGQRVFNVSFAATVVNDKYLWQGQWHDEKYSDDFDIVEKAGGAEVGTVAPFLGCYPEPVDYRKNVSLFLFLSSLESEFPPILNAVELYEVIVPIPQPCPKLKMKSGWNATQTSPPEDSGSEGGPSTGKIVGIVVGCVIGGVLLVGGIVLLMKLRSHQKATSFQRFHQSEGLVS